MHPHIDGISLHNAMSEFTSFCKMFVHRQLQSKANMHEKSKLFKFSGVHPSKKSYVSPCVSITSYNDALSHHDRDEHQCDALFA
ncbi:MAG TPA: hypothetical protein DCE42_25575 [Myxococcales bacterium]|nr:hypothetical protein [Deltaproteobacteria bacterium]MBU53872.1 hypothetical protein [Deltaproteobacteria bacterium]HAA58159.1 hypothetical protein [Myxococcales bacterium]